MKHVEIASAQFTKCLTSFIPRILNGILPQILGELKGETKAFSVKEVHLGMAGLLLYICGMYWPSSGEQMGRCRKQCPP